MGILQALEPKNEFNRELEQNVRPTDWINPTPDGTYNLVVIGAGTAGLVAAAGAAGLGAKVALIERNLMGGDCLNAGCVPSKGLIRAARAAAAVRGSGRFGMETGGEIRCDFAAAMQRMRRLRAEISKHDSTARFRDMGVDVYIGEGRFSGPKSVEVDGQTLEFSKAVIATGSRAAAPPIDGLDGVDTLTNESVFSLTELPQRLGIIGAGPIGAEMSQAFARFGSEVFLIEAKHGILQKEDEDCSSIVQTAMGQDGVKLLCCGKDVRVSPGNGGARLQLESHDESYDHTVDRLLVAVGRAPNIERLNLEAAGVEATKHGITVDDKLRTSNHDIFAAGDVCTKYKFTHVADFMARIVIQNALFMGHSRFSDLVVPWCTYTSPEIAHVGITEKDAEQQGLDIDTYRRKFDEVDRAVLDGESEGFIVRDRGPCWFVPNAAGDRLLQRMMKGAAPNGDVNAARFLARLPAGGRADYPGRAKLQYRGVQDSDLCPAGRHSRRRYNAMRGATAREMDDPLRFLLGGGDPDHCHNHAEGGHTQSGVLAAGSVFDIQARLHGMLHAIEGLGAVGYAVFLGVYVLACVFFIPGSILTLGAGAIYGVVMGTILVKDEDPYRQPVQTKWNLLRPLA